MQTTNTVLMVRPTAFTANPETMRSNSFQKHLTGITDIAAKARQGFDGYASALTAAGITVHVVDDIREQATPDSLFPNNWLAMTGDGTIYTFPMEAINRRRERRQDIIADIASDFIVTRRIDLSQHESQGYYLEGTGSLILDHENKLAYACRSSRSSYEVGREFERLSGYRIHWFNARDRQRQPIYHTNVMLSVGRRFAMVCLEAVHAPDEREQLLASLGASGKTVIAVTYEQMASFTCNVLELCDSQGSPVYAMSTRAWQAFTPPQQQTIADYARLALAPIDIIEDLGGGGARCMLCEIFLRKRMAGSDGSATPPAALSHR
ncbi:citrulline utilization hydrolase CtlX [Pantoea sp. B65]|uniref:citrulline utilization hydrolase CtlX n=1 Tax=Pantoea sp. B65 TaxID=2813359 RepID=UPI0039B5D940